MSYLPDMDEYQTRVLEAEIVERKKRHAAGVCSYCMRDHGRYPYCKFPKRHDGTEI